MEQNETYPRSANHFPITNTKVVMNQGTDTLIYKSLTEVKKSRVLLQSPTLIVTW
jgi:hypothetical protein